MGYVSEEFSILPLGRDKTGKFIKGHKKIGGRRKGSLNFYTKVIQDLLSKQGLEGHMRREKIVEGLLVIAIEGNLYTTKRIANYIFAFLDEPLLAKIFRKSTLRLKGISYPTNSRET